MSVTLKRNPKLGIIHSEGRPSMSADWYYLRHGWFHKGKKIGPIDEHDFLLRIDQGDIQPDTLVQSEVKTKGRWIRMEKVKPALQRWEQTHPKV